MAATGENGPNKGERAEYLWSEPLRLGTMG